MNKLKGLFRLRVGEAEAGIRLDQFLAANLNDISRGECRKIIDLGGVHIDGRRTRSCSHAMRSGQQVVVHVDGLPLTPFCVEPCHILYRDRYLLAVNKPAGVETQPTHARYKGTLYEALLSYLRDPFRPQLRPELGMIQRLDRETSGAIIFSIHQRAHRGMTQAVQQRTLKKLYWALVKGVPRQPESEISSQLARTRDANRVKSVSQGGKPALTRYRVVEERGDVALLEVEIVTGRSHQIRVHLAELGHPLLGDRKYGGPCELRGVFVERHMLHSRLLGCMHPLSGEPLEITAPLAQDMLVLLGCLGFTEPGDNTSSESTPC